MTKDTDAGRVLYATFRWAGGVHRFALPMAPSPLTLEYQAHGVIDPQPRLNRLLLNQNTVGDIAGTIRGGLIGGKAYRVGDPTLDALIRDQVLRRPLADGALLAKAILLVAVFGIPKTLADQTIEPFEIVSEATGDHVKATAG